MQVKIKGKQEVREFELKQKPVKKSTLDHQIQNSADKLKMEVTSDRIKAYENFG